MDVEAAKDDLSVEDGQLVVFDNIEYIVPKGIHRKYSYNISAEYLDISIACILLVNIVYISQCFLCLSGLIYVLSG